MRHARSCRCWSKMHGRMWTRNVSIQLQSPCLLLGRLINLLRSMADVYNYKSTHIPTPTLPWKTVSLCYLSNALLFDWSCTFLWLLSILEFSAGVSYCSTSLRLSTCIRNKGLYISIILAALSSCSKQSLMQDLVNHIAVIKIGRISSFLNDRRSFLTIYVRD